VTIPGICTIIVTQIIVSSLPCLHKPSNRGQFHVISPTIPCTPLPALRPLCGIHHLYNKTSVFNGMESNTTALEVLRARDMASPSRIPMHWISNLPRISRHFKAKQQGYAQETAVRTNSLPKQLRYARCPQRKSNTICPSDSTAPAAGRALIRQPFQRKPSFHQRPQPFNLISWNDLNIQAFTWEIHFHLPPRTP
jgi:hypothetical protein